MNVKETTLDILLSSNATVNERDENDITPLCLAIQTNAEDFRKLLTAGADLSDGEETIFEKCIALDDLSFLNTLLEVKGSTFVCDSLFFNFWSQQTDDVLRENKPCVTNVIMQMLATPQKINVNTKNRSGNTLLVFFCGQNESKIVEKLLERGADVNTICRNDWTALHALYHSSDSDVDQKNHVLSLLMKMNPDVHIKDDTGKTVFEKAQEEYNGHMYYNFSRNKFLSTLIKEILIAGGKCEMLQLASLLQSASQRQHFSLMAVLVQRGADLTCETRVLHLCFSSGRYYRDFDTGSQKEECLNFLTVYKKHGGRLNEVDNQGNTPLMVYLNSMFYENLKQEDLNDSRDEIVSILANNKYTVTRRNNTGQSPIHIASMKGRLNTVKLLESKGANLCDREFEENTCLHLYLSKGSREALKETVVYLIERGVSVNHVNRKGEVPLFLLIKNGHTSPEFESTVRFLLKSGADPNIQLKHNNPFVAAIRLNFINVAAIFLEYGAKVNEIEDGPTALHVLFKYYRGSRKDYFEELICMNSNIVVNAVGKTEINTAVKSDCMEDQIFQIEHIVQKILDCGADINALDENGHTPLSIVCGEKSYDTAERARIGIYLMSMGADPNMDYALQKAIENIDYCNSKAEWSKFILTMIEMGANPDIYKNEKPIILSATKSGSSDIVKKLLDKGADIHATDCNENTCLHLACNLEVDIDRNMIASLLLQHGCSVNRSNSFGAIPLSNLIRRITQDRDSTKCVPMETTTYAEVDLTLFNLLICGGSHLDIKIKTSFYNNGESILAHLTRHGYLKAAGTLIKCGYDFQNDEDFRNCDLERPAISGFFIRDRWYKRIGYENEKKEFLKLLEMYEERIDFSLSSLCRDVIRKHLINVGHGSEIESKIMLLPLPGRIKTYLTFREHTEEVEKIQIENKDSSAYLYTSGDSEDDYDYDGIYDSDFWAYDQYADDYEYCCGYDYDSDFDSF